jgi:hypothetical protein
MRALLFLLVSGIVCLGADETLSYSIKWPTGISMGRATLKVTQGSTRSDFELDTSLPGIPATGAFTSRLDAKGCTSEFSKKYELGFRKSSETTTMEDGKARRETSKGGKSTFDPGPCPKDALAFLQLLRAELIAGRKPASQKILFGAEYNLTLEYPKSADDKADTVKVNLKGPASQHTFEIDFLRDSTRPPVRVRVPLAMGKFVLDLTH